MRRLIWISIAVVLLAVVAAVVLRVRIIDKETETIQIGAILPLTGDGAKYGEEAQNGINLATKKINQSGGILGKKLIIIYEDDQGVAKNAVAAFKKLSSFEKVQVVIGPMYSSTALAVVPIAEQHKIVLFSPSASSPEYSSAGDYIFRNWPSDVFEGSVMANFAYQQLRFRRIAILYVNLDYGVGLAKVFKETFEKHTGNITILEQYLQGATDFRTQLLKIKDAGVDAVYLPGYYAEIGLILKQAKELNIPIKFLSCVGFDNPKVIEIAGDSAEGVIFARPAYDPENKESIVSNFVNEFKKQYGLVPGTYAAHAYDAIIIATEAMKQTKNLSSEEIKNALYNIKEFPCVTGKITFDNNGDVIAPIQIILVKDGEFQFYKESKI